MMPWTPMTDDLEPLRRLCEQAGQAILAVRRRGFDIEAKADASPVTEADRLAHAILAEGLASLSGLPLLSEEGREVPWVERRAWSKFWLVDPLDGTREFVDGFDDFTVNVALVERGRPLLGVVHAPASGTSWAGVVGRGAWGGGGGGRAAVGGAPRRAARRRARRRRPAPA